MSLKKEDQIAIVEMGANHIGEIRKLCEIVKPTHGIITSIGKAHIDGFGSLKNITQAKNELFDYLKANNGFIIYNKKNKILKKLINDYKKVVPYNIPMFSIEENAEKKLENNMSNIEESWSYYCNPFIKIYTRIEKNNIIQTKIIGKYNINNIMAAIRISDIMGVSLNTIIHKLKSIQLKNNRSEFIETNKNDIILDAYNANPTSMSEAIKNFIDINIFLKYKKILFILGDMLELGENEIHYHQEIIDLLDNNNIRNCILVGNIFNKTKCKKEYQKVKSIIECNKLIKHQKIEKTSILIKGSRKLGLEKTLTLL